MYSGRFGRTHDLTAPALEVPLHDCSSIVCGGLGVIYLAPDVATAMRVHAANCHPEECCGLVASDAGGVIRMAYPLTNSLSSPTNYTIEPREHIKVLRHAESLGWEISGVFHSHPYTLAYPSPTDVALAAEPDWLYFVIGMQTPDAPEIRAFRIADSQVLEQQLTFDG